MIFTRCVISAFLLSMLELLSGCASLNSQFDCPTKPGVMCKSLDEVNSMVDQGKLGDCSSCSDSFAGAFSKSSHDVLSTKVTCMWIAPYQDKEGQDVTSTIIYREIKPNQSVNPPIKILNAARGETA